jgi:hypothetical protein
VFDHSERSIRIAEALRISSSNVSTVRKTLKARQSIPSSNGVVIFTVDELQQLNRELDVTKATGAEFDLVVSFSFRNVFGNAFAHALG